MAGIAVVEILMIRLGREEAPLFDPGRDRLGEGMGLGQLRDIVARDIGLFGRLGENG